MKNIFFFSLLALLAIGCSEQTESEQTPTETSSESIHLNKGDKWLVNEEMKPFVLDAENILKEYIASKESDYNSLAASLQEKNEGLINSCTMEGESHEELHKWLHPHMDLIEALANAETPEKAESLVAQLSASFVTFHTYFQ